MAHFSVRGLYGNLQFTIQYEHTEIVRTLLDLERGVNGALRLAHVHTEIVRPLLHFIVLACQPPHQSSSKKLDWTHWTAADHLPLERRSICNYGF